MSKSQKEIPIWRIKYLPQTLKEICGREKVKQRLQEIINQQNFPHLLFIGSEGVGKTTIADLFAKEFLGKYYDANLKIVYADVSLTDEEWKQARSDAYVSTSKIGSIAGKRITSPAFIQVKVKPFVQLKVLGGAPYKILIVKNFEALGNNQQGFRRLMEIYGNNCRMILITTKISGIIDPIISRCQLILVPQVEYGPFKELILHIVEKEGLSITDDVLESLYQISEGKIAKAIDILQLSSSSTSSIDMDLIFENLQQYHQTLVKSLLLMILRGDFPKSRELARKVVENYKYSISELFTLLLKEIHKLKLSKAVRIRLYNLIADADFRAIDGLDDDIQISALIAKMCKFSESI